MWTLQLFIFAVFVFAQCHANIRDFIPLDAPQNLTLVKIDGNEVFLEWDPVRPESVRGSFRGYIVRVWNHGYSQVYALPPDVTKASVQFFPYSKNFITVSARNDKFVGPRSTAISFDAPQTDPNHPYLFEYYQLGPNSIFLQWNKPTKPNGVLLGYKIYWSEMNDFGINPRTTVTRVVNDPEKYQAKISGLKEGVRYQIGLAAVNCAGESEQNTLEVTLGDKYTPASPSIPFLKFKIDYKDVDPKVVCRTTNTIPDMTETPTVPEIDFDDFGDDYFVFNDTQPGKIVKPKKSPKSEHTIIDPNPCFVDCRVTWIPDVENNPGDHFLVKYRLKGQKEFQVTEPELDKDFIILKEFNGCRSYEIVLTAIDGEFQTDSYPQETPAVLFMYQH